MTLTNVWARTGSRPTAVRQTRYEWCYLYAAIEPATGESAALIAPNVDTPTMNQFLKVLDAERKPDEHFVLIMDQAGWHKSKALKLPDGITVLLLPPYSPELNPTENLWHYMRSHYLSNRIYEDYDALLTSLEGPLPNGMTVVASAVMPASVRAAPAARAALAHATTTGAATPCERFTDFRDFGAGPEEKRAAVVRTPRPAPL